MTLTLPEPPVPFLPGLSIVSSGLRTRNIAADTHYYDVGNLTERERARMVAETTLEGAILVVHPWGGAESDRIQKFEDFRSFRHAPGDLLRHFTVAGVGSSDLGAASLARTLANRVEAPVGAIVAGYGVADLMSEALGGWAFFRVADQMRGLMARAEPEPELTTELARETRPTYPPAGGSLPGDTRTLLALLGEADRQIDVLLGHSKGCLSIAFALNRLVDDEHAQAPRRLAETTVITAGAVVTLPRGHVRAQQFLGRFDALGAINSTLDQPFVSVPRAGHSLNTERTLPLDLAGLLRGAL